MSAPLPGWDDAPPTPLDEACLVDIARAEACSRAGWALSAFDDAARSLDDGRRGGRLRAALRLRGLAYGAWDRVVAEAVRVRVPGPFAAAWAGLAEQGRRESEAERERWARASFEQLQAREVRRWWRGVVDRAARLADREREDATTQEHAAKRKPEAMAAA